MFGLTRKRGFCLLLFLFLLLISCRTRAWAEDAYALALAATARCEFEEALALTNPADMEKQEKVRKLRTFCEERLAAESVPLSKRYTSAERVIEDFESGRLYLCEAGYLFVPNSCDESTRCCIYFGGGVGDENWLYLKGMYAYFRHNSPNAVFLFHFHSHVEKPDLAAERAMRILGQVALEQGIVLHDILTVGSSTGSLTALRAAAAISQSYVFPVRAAIALDAPNEWDCVKRWLPTDEEYAQLAAHQTALYLFEQPGVGAEKAPIAAMLEHGCDVSIVECKHDDHNIISENAYYKAVFSWGLGELEELDEAEYTLVPLS